MIYFTMYPPCGAAFGPSITRWGCLLITFPSSLPFHVTSSSLNDDVLNTIAYFILTIIYYIQVVENFKRNIHLISDF